MLVLSRKEQEKIIITIPPSTEVREVELLILDTGRGRVKIGFTGPETVKIRRSEIDPR